MYVAYGMYRHSIFDLVLMSYVNTFPPFYLEDHCDTNCPKDPQDPGGALMLYVLRYLLAARLSTAASNLGSNK